KNGQVTNASIFIKLVHMGNFPLAPFAFKKPQNALPEFLIFLHECPLPRNKRLCKILSKNKCRKGQNNGKP
ncbi:MAG: hypothetical protein OSJ42_12890, partial [Bacteroidales bacterium]|nr:hypothetical protein [Bacteroidales bacterium]